MKFTFSMLQAEIRIKLFCCHFQQEQVTFNGYNIQQVKAVTQIKEGGIKL